MKTIILTCTLFLGAATSQSVSQNSYAFAKTAIPPFRGVFTQLHQNAAAGSSGTGALLFHDPQTQEQTGNAETYQLIHENPFQQPLLAPLSTAGIGAGGASFSNIRRYLSNNKLPKKDAVRIDEMINYFDYGYPDPAEDALFSVNTELVSCPWSDNGSILFRLGVKAKGVGWEDAPANNLVLLLDVSSSMNTENKLPLAKTTIRLLLDQLRPQDKVAVVAFAGTAKIIMPSITSYEKDSILSLVNRIKAGSLDEVKNTAGAAALRMAYKEARKNFIKNGNNRLILASDGDFNDGQSTIGDILEMITSEREKGISLSCIGFGKGSFNDKNLSLLADAGMGQYQYIDNVMEVKKVLVNSISSALNTVAQDVEMQIEFNPAVVRAYRMVGYDTHGMSPGAFAGNDIGAGEIGAGQNVTVLYEIIPNTSEGAIPGGGITDSLRYQLPCLSPIGQDSSELLTFRINYQEPGSDERAVVSQSVRYQWSSYTEASKDTKWAATAASFGMLLRNSPYLGNLTYPKVLKMGRDSRGKDKSGQRNECLKMIESAGLLEGIR